jgi:Leucine-rich repeat (LRR) protein
LISDSGIECLTNLTYLNADGLNADGFNADGFNADGFAKTFSDNGLKKLVNLTYLQTHETNITNCALVDMHKLTEFDITGTKISYDGIKHLKHLKKLCAYSYNISLKDIEHMNIKIVDLVEPFDLFD